MQEVVGRTFKKTKSESFNKSRSRCSSSSSGNIHVRPEPFVFWSTVSSVIHPAAKVEYPVKCTLILESELKKKTDVACGHSHEPRE